MKAKPIIIIFGILLLITAIALFVRSRNMAKPQQSDVAQFLKQFDTNLEAGNIDSLNSYLETNQHGKLTAKLFNILSNKTGADGKSDPLFKMVLHTDRSQITILSNELVQVSIPVTFAHDKVATAQAFLLLKLHAADAHHYKIIQIDARRLLADLVVYEKKIKTIGMGDKDLYSAITLASFKVAESLKPKYDSVLWFQHIGGKTYYFVVKGAYKSYYPNDSAKNAAKDAYKMGLVNPDLKEIIPPKYDLVHNVSGTIDGLIEVENGDKKGFFDADGKNVVPVEYDQAFPLSDDASVALLRKGDDYFYLKKDFTVSDKLVNLKIADEIKKIKNFANSFKLEEQKSDDIMEYNSREDYNSIIIPPAYLVEWGILPQIVDLPNHLRKMSDEEMGDGEGNEWYEVNFDGHKTESTNWFETAYYSVVDSYLGSRSGLYTTKNILVIDKNKNRVLSFGADSYYGLAEGGGYLSGKCNDNYVRQLNDTLFEYKTTSIFEQPLLNDSVIYEAPYYHYLHIKDGKLVALPNGRLFGFTKYVKMDDSYLSGCYTVGSKQVDHMTSEMLQFAKNEIYANYKYKFKSAKWTEVFQSRFGRYDDDKNVNVDDSLTSIDKYNINWISQKLKVGKPNTLAAK